jgi:hypothetical protein
MVAGWRNEASCETARGAAAGAAGGGRGRVLGEISRFNVTV